jgi:hypothetical protein
MKYFSVSRCKFFAQLQLALINFSSKVRHRPWKCVSEVWTKLTTHLHVLPVLRIVEPSATSLYALSAQEEIYYYRCVKLPVRHHIVPMTRKLLA